jgi:hypothetical protein
MFNIDLSNKIILICFVLIYFLLFFFLFELWCGFIKPFIKYKIKCFIKKDIFEIEFIELKLKWFFCFLFILFRKLIKYLEPTLLFGLFLIWINNINSDLFILYIRFYLCHKLDKWLIYLNIYYFYDFLMIRRLFFGFIFYLLYLFILTGVTPYEFFLGCVETYRYFRSFF